MPEQIPDTTKAGNPTLRRLGKRERNDFYVQVLCGHVLATVRETLAVAPGIDSVRAAALRAEGRTAYGASKLGCVLATRFTRQGLQQVAWDITDAASIVTQAATEHFLRRGGPAHDVLALDLTGEPDLQALLEAVTTDDDTDIAGQDGPQETLAIAPPATVIRPSRLLGRSTHGEHVERGAIAARGHSTIGHHAQRQPTLVPVELIRRRAGAARRARDHRQRPGTAASPPGLRRRPEHAAGADAADRSAGHGQHHRGDGGNQEPGRRGHHRR